MGGIYSLFGISAATGSNFTGWNEEDGSPVDIYAAMHDGYAAQHKVGKILINSNDPSKVEVGKKMLQCASNALPIYKKIFAEKK